MDLQFALIIFGIALVFLVFAVSRYSSTLEKYWNRLRHSKALKPSGKRSGKGKHAHDSYKPGRGRRADQAPRLGDTDNNHQADEPLFEFESDSFSGQTPDTLISEVVADESEPVEFSDTPVVEQVEDYDVGSEPLLSLRDEHDDGLPKHVGPFTSLRQIDYWIKLSPASPVTQREILSKLTHWDKIQFPVQLHALTQEDPHWENLLETPADVLIVDVVASYQLLSSGNAASIADLNTFDEQATDLGRALAAEKLMMATPEQALDQSLKLAQFYADSCEPLEVSICAPEGQPFMGKLVETSAKQQGLDFMEGAYVRQKRMASHNVILYSMHNVDKRHGYQSFDEDMLSTASIECVKFTMMPVLSQTPGRDAKEMLDAVKAFASRVKGDIRVPGESEFHQELLLKLRNRVSRLEKDTIDAGLEPGGQEIYRIFS